MQIDLFSLYRRKPHQSSLEALGPGPRLVLVVVIKAVLEGYGTNQVKEFIQPFVSSLVTKTSFD
jgi:hypothetical protein